MPDIKILRNGQQIVSKRFYGHFFVSGSNKVIFWRTDEDKHWSTDEVDSESPESIEGAQRQFAMIKTIRGYELSPILPSWGLRINGQTCERGFYGDIDIVWQEVRLSHRDYEFVFQFGQEEIETKAGDSTILPRPLLPGTQIK